MRPNRIIRGFVSFVMRFRRVRRVSVLEFGLMGLRQIQVTQMLNILILYVLGQVVLLRRVILAAGHIQRCLVEDVTPLASTVAAAAMRRVLVLRRISGRRSSISNFQQIRDVLMARTDTQIVCITARVMGRIW
jgi:hypothetical protein